MDELPPFLLAQLTEIPEEPPQPFVCAVCNCAVNNDYCYSPREFERPPICLSCETCKGFSWNGRSMSRTKPSGGSHRDRRNAIRIAALADALAEEANRQKWSKTHAA